LFSSINEMGRNATRLGEGRSAMIFAAKTTASALIALLVAFTFNLDQPQWSLLTVFIVAQPQTGLVLAKSFYRIIGTLVGAPVALCFIALFAQERVLFLGALALWIGLCTFGSQYARNFTAYSFVLSGYTVAIVGIPGALDAGHAFYIATARVTEISLGIIATALVSHIILPSSLAASLWQAIADVCGELADYAVAVLGNGDVVPARAKLIGKAIAIENLRASASFEDREVRAHSSSLRRLNLALIDVLAATQRLGGELETLRRAEERMETGINEALPEAAAAVKAWRAGEVDAAGLHNRLLQACARLRLPRLREFFAAFTAYAEADEAHLSGKSVAVRSVGFTFFNDPVVALWTGLRATVAVVLVGSFWILSNWPHGSTAVILAAVATARLATMGHAVPISVAATLIFSLTTIPAFVIVEVLLPLASGFEMFSLIVAPVIFCCALLMALKKTQLIGFFSGLLFASVGLFQNRMVYDPIGLLNTSIAAVFAAGTALVLWSVLAPETPEAARSRFLRAARQAFAKIMSPQPRTGLAEFEIAMTAALDQWQSHLRLDRPDDIAAFEEGVAFLGAGRELVRSREERGTSAGTALDPLGFAPDQEAKLFERERALL
jgi:uncharacterized membrane protein YccC